MYLCSSNHEEICYEAGDCPLCAAQKENDRLEDALSDVRSEYQNQIDSLNESKSDMQSEIDNLTETINSLRDNEGYLPT
jgi:uncharacterized protein YlxW (UPF0749 family)